MLTGASDLASPFFTPRVFLDGISILFVYAIYILYKNIQNNLYDYFVLSQVLSSSVADRISP